MMGAGVEGVQEESRRSVECDHWQMVIWAERGGGRKRRVIVEDEVHATLGMELFSPVSGRR
jgi:hypothetical protein